MTSLFNFLFDLSLKNNVLAWPAIFLIKDKKCAPAARYLQLRKGGKLVYAIPYFWQDNKICDHFMNLIDGQIIDYYGNTAIRLDQDHISFNNHVYKIIQIADSWRDFNISSKSDLIKQDIKHHNEMNGLPLNLYFANVDIKKEALQ